MEVWTFIHKETNEIIRCGIRAGDIEFGAEYYFTTSEYEPIWFVETENEANNAYKDFVHPQYLWSYKTPSTNRININDYKICKFELKN